MGLVERVVRHPAVWPHVHDDGTPGDWEPVDHEVMHWMLVQEGAEVLGVFLVHPVTSYCYEMHTCLLPEAWGPRAIEAARMLADWAFSQTPCLKLVTNVPEYNRLALRFAKAGGGKQEGINRASFMRDGKMLDQIVLGITKKEWLTCRQRSQ